jgi:hypothetical protein
MSQARSSLLSRRRLMWPRPPVEPPPVPLERVEARICELAGHLAAATCRFLVLLADFDARRGWASWEMNSCAQWLSWKCQMSSGTAREHVRVARALRDPPWYGERLDLDHAICTCFANARTEEEKQADRNQDGDPATRGRVTVYKAEDWPERIRQYEAQTPRRFAPVLVPIQV